MRFVATPRKPRTGLKRQEVIGNEMGVVRRDTQKTQNGIETSPLRREEHVADVSRHPENPERD